jgi:hypothetical protein
MADSVFCQIGFDFWPGIASDWEEAKGQLNPISISAGLCTAGATAIFKVMTRVRLPASIRMHEGHLEPGTQEERPWK